MRPRPMRGVLGRGPELGLGVWLLEQEVGPTWEALPGERQPLEGRPEPREERQEAQPVGPQESPRHWLQEGREACWARRRVG